MNRRNFLGMGAAALAGMALVPSLTSCAGGENTKVAKRDGDKPNSNFGGVHMGTITYSWRDQKGGLDNLISYCKQANVSNLELMGNDLETCLGAPQSPMMTIMQAVNGRLTPEQRQGMRGFGGFMDFMNDAEKAADVFGFPSDQLDKLLAAQKFASVSQARTSTSTS